MAKNVNSGKKHNNTQYLKISTEFELAVDFWLHQERI